MKPNTLAKRMLDYIHREQLWRPGDAILISVSGGLDSMVLLHLLAKNQAAHKAQLRVISFDHGVRPESKEEVAFVAQKASEYKIDTDIISLDLCKEQSHFQERAREARRAEWAKYREHRVATAHHGNDQAETVLFRLLRGSGLTGLRGMLPRQDKMVRPLLFAFRKDIENYAEYHGIEWREDPSNAVSWRGKLRSMESVLAELRANPMQSLAQTARLLAREEDYLSGLAQQHFERVKRQNALDYGLLRSLHPALQLRVLRVWLGEWNVVPHAKQAEAFLHWTARNGSRIYIAKQAELSMEQGLLCVKLK